VGVGVSVGIGVGVGVGVLSGFRTNGKYTIESPLWAAARLKKRNPPINRRIINMMQSIHQESESFS
jgi:hypothetical protein